MKKLILVLTTLLLFSFVSAELINNNPDPNGEPWISGGVSPLTPEQQKKIDEIPVLLLPDEYKNRKEELPYTVDNSTQPYFRPIFNQVGGSCGQASGVGYTYTYEQNFKRGTSADITDNQYPTHYTYNFLNSGSGGNGSWHWDGWDIIKASGIPNVTDYGGMLWPSTDYTLANSLWMDGYSKYQNGMNNRVLEQIAMPLNTPEGLEVLKQWMNDHCDGSEAGGIAVFAAGVSYTFQRGILPMNSFCPGESVVLKWDENVNHAMTFIGYNDSIRWDYNTDGKYTNDIDITGDGIVDMRDWEIGGLKMANSWGTSWANSGKSWVMYRTLAQSLADGGIYNNIAHSIKTRESFVPTLKLKATINYSERNDIKIMAGIANDLEATVPEHTITFPHFNFQGGDGLGMKGDGDVLELGLDITPLLSYANSDSDARFFICVEHNGNAGGRGNIASFAIVDEEGTETPSSQTGVAIINGVTTYAYVDASATFDKANITTTDLPIAAPGQEYSYTLTAENGTPPYYWDMLIDYSEVTNESPFPYDDVIELTMSNDDDGYAIIQLDFAFPFFGKTYDYINVSTNGSISFGENFEDVRDESDIRETKTIAPYVTDLMSYPEDGEGIFYYKNEDYVLVRWITSMFDLPEVDLDFTAKLHSDGKIEFFYGSGFTTGIEWGAGISNGSVISALISELSNTDDPSDMKTSFSTDPYPYGIEISSNGIFSGIINTGDTSWDLMFRVTDDKNISAFKELVFSTSTGIDDNGQFTVDNLQLEQNYPNPFNPVTTINFSVINNDKLSMHIYNIKGEIVDTLFDNKKFNSGNYTINWNSGKELSSGIYYYGIETESGLKQMKKMTLLK
ncbi:MAG: T9SS type A sorting domain-containing protein [Candidatus Delongbacteria bacterium]|nr:T9SS type A sorting domain-containing protein [Candidatus Delongbacteria bacterium]